MRNPVFYISKPKRKAEFRTETRIYKIKDGGFSVVKSAYEEEAQAHIDNMFITYEKLVASPLSKKLKILKPNKLHNNLEYEYIEGDPVDRVLLDLLIAENYKEAYKLVDFVFNAIDSLTTEENISPQTAEFTSVFGKSYKAKQACTNYGAVDLNFDNLKVVDDKYYLFDYEWYFGFNIPVAYLKARQLWYFFKRHKESFDAFSESIDSMILGKQIIVPTDFYNNYRNIFDSLDEFLMAEHYFQSYALDFYSEFTPKNLEPEEYSNSNFGLPSILLKTKAKAHSDTTEVIKKLKSDNKNLEKELLSIKSSKSYKLALKISRAKKKIT